jgi:hypothetical protein
MIAQRPDLPWLSDSVPTEESTLNVEVPYKNPANEIKDNVGKSHVFVIRTIARTTPVNPASR